MNGKGRNTYHFLFKPGQIGNVETKNRIVMLPLGTAFGTQFGAVTQRTVDHYVERAKGGAGLLTVGNISPSSPNVSNQLSLESDGLLMGHYELVEKVHAYDAKIIAQLNLAGRQKYPEGLRADEEIVSSSALRGSFLGKDYPLPKALRKEEITAILKKFSDAAVRAQKVGYDVVELHCAHGYLINQFLSPFMNQRTDEYGGSLANRMCFLLDLVALLKENLGDDYPLGVRLSAEEFVAGGVTLKESKLISKELEKAGVSYISVSVGTFETFHTFVDGMREPEGWKEYIWEAVKQAVNIPVIAGGGLRHPGFCERLLKQEKADFIGLARPLLADPKWPSKAKQGNLKDLRLCIFCNECLFGSARRRQGGGARRCTVNPDMGRDRDFTRLKKAPEPKKVMIVGGGPAGMEAARIAALRGHQVTIFEKKNYLGGQILLAGKIKSKNKLMWFCSYLKKQLKKLNVKIELGLAVDYELIKSFKPEGVVIATGAVPATISIPGIERETVLNGIEMLEKNIKLYDKKIAVLSRGGGIGCEIAEHLVDMGNRITVIEKHEELASGMEPINRYSLLNKLDQNHVNVLVHKDATEITSDGVVTRCLRSGREHFVDAEYIVIAAGTASNRQLPEGLEEKMEFYAAGDCIRPRGIMEAVYEGSLAGRKL